MSNHRHTTRPSSWKWTGYILYPETRSIAPPPGCASPRCTGARAPQVISPRLTVESHTADIFYIRRSLKGRTEGRCCKPTLMSYDDAHIQSFHATCLLDTADIFYIRRLGAYRTSICRDGKIRHRRIFSRDISTSLSCSGYILYPDKLQGRARTHPSWQRRNAMVTVFIFLFDQDVFWTTADIHYIREALKFLVCPTCLTEA